MILYKMEGKQNIFKRELETLIVFFFNLRLNLDFELIFQCFGNLHIALFIWLIMQLCTAVVVFMGFYYWTNNRIFYCRDKKKLSKKNLIDSSPSIEFWIVLVLIVDDS